MYIYLLKFNCQAQNVPVCNSKIEWNRKYMRI